ncbi:ABC transporter G family member 20-like [Asterias amurensis]|uniref:ABC transporter G family member 20-like n=1 Tax=Asterias amurensis TaxID=7602 RepID=UPI003AB71C8E
MNAIECNNVCKHYGRGTKRLDVLQNLNMTVPRGTIYGLLGPSGCGKTTLLRCILGRLKTDRGTVLTLGKPPGTKGLGIPGSMVGYMPQETALFDDFTISETLNYFGTIHQMAKADLKKRKVFLIELLNLPGLGSRVGNLSGGQKRRVSFAAALVQSPPLLILDEPTVGVDPLLRIKIWDHLIQFAQKSQTTIILTTHYIEEARQANIVGLMRNGQLLSESHPLELINRHQLPTLEDVFLKLCMQDTSNSGEAQEHVNPTEVIPHISNSSSENINQGVDGKEVYTSDRELLLDDDSQVQMSRPLSSCCKNDFFSLSRLWALMVKNVIRIMRNPGVVFFSIIIPILQTSLFCLAIGNDPRDLPVAVVNNEVPPQLSLLYLQNVNNYSVHQVPVANFSTAMDGAKNGDYWGIIEFGANFTKDLITRFEDPTKATAQIIDGGSVHVSLDMTNSQIAIALQQDMLLAFEKLTAEFLPNPAVAQIPVIFEKPIYGSSMTKFIDFLAPGIIVTIVFFLAMGITALSLVIERKEGLLDRSWVAGVSATEVMLSHVLVQGTLTILQSVIVLVFVLGVFSIPNEGSLFLVALMCFLQGLCGQAFGLFASSVCSTEVTVMQLTQGFFYPTLLLSGIIWPIQSMPDVLYYISICLPQTFANEGLRGVLSKGWGLEHFEVWIGYVITLSWTVLFLFMSAGFLRLSK